MADETQHLDVATYAAAVRHLLSDLPATEREALTEDLEDHLAEVFAESGSPLEVRLGSPADYAAELRRAYGAGLPTKKARFGRTKRLLTSATASLSRWPTYMAIRGYLPELRPAWWVLRAYLVVLVLAVVLRGDQEIHPIPNPFSSQGLLELIAMALAIMLSIKLGRRTAQRPGPSWLMRTGNAVVAIAGLIALGSMSTPPAWVSYGYASTDTRQLDVRGYGFPVTNIYPYTLDGKPLQGVLLYDQDGRPVTIDARGYGLVVQYPTAADGRPITNQYPLNETWPDGTEVQAPKVILPPSPASSPSAPSPSPSPSATPNSQ
jgi:hypothetical protein